MRLRARTCSAALLSLCTIYASPVLSQQEAPIPRSVAGDKGKYYLLEAKRTGDIVKALHKRVGVDSVGYTRTETNCKTMLMREIGYSEESAAKIRATPQNGLNWCQGQARAISQSSYASARNDDG